MSPKLLLTSFETWLPHQKSNTSDDLLGQIVQLDSFSKTWSLLRQLPVHRQLATDLVISEIDRFRPMGAICCGMAEKRTQMMVESQAICGDSILKTTLDLDRLVADLAVTDVSDDAGNFVCNDFYYGILKYLSDLQLPCQCLFVHVPLLSSENLEPIVADFLAICRGVERQCWVNVES